MVAVTADKVITVLELRDGDFNSRVRANEALFTRAKANEARAAITAERQIRASQSAIAGSLRSTAGAIAAGFTAGAVKNLADGYTRFTNQLKLAGLEGTRLSSTQEALFASAQKYGVELEGLGTLYGRISQAGKDLGATQADLLKFTNGVAAAIKVQGASAGAAQGALLQLSQALGGATVRAEEYNSINEGARPILQAVAAGSDRFKGSVTALRAAVIDGTVSSREFYAAFLKGSGDLEEQATKANLTIAASLTVLNNALGRYIGQTDEALSATQRVSQSINLLADNLDTIVPVIGALIVLVGARYVGALASSTAATLAGAAASGFRTRALQAEALAQAQMLPITSAATAAMLRQNAAVAVNATRSVGALGAVRSFGAGLMGLAGGPIGVAIIAVAALAAGILYLSDKYGESAVAARRQAQVVAAASSALDAYEDAARAAANATGAAKEQADRHAAAMRVDAAATLANARASLELARARAVEAQRKAIAEEADVRTSLGPGQTTLNQGQAFAARVRAQNATEQLFQAGVDFATLDNRARAIEAQIRNGSLVNAPVTASGGDDKGRGRTASGPTPEELAAMREMLRLEGQLAILEASGRTYDAEQIKARIDKIRLTEQLTDAGVVGAAAVADAQIDAERRATAATRGREVAIERTKALMDIVKEALEAQTVEMDRQLQVQIDLARIQGNDRVANELERELRVRQAIAQLGPNATPGQRAAVGADEIMLNNAERREETLDTYRGAARSFLEIIRAEDIGTEIGTRLREAAFDKLEDILTNVAGMIFGGPGIGGGAMAGGGGGLGGLFASALGGLFGGRRALGGPVQAGKVYRINEQDPRSEYFSPNANGYVSPSAERPARQAPRIFRQDVNVKTELYLDGANGDAAIYGNVRRMLADSEQRTLGIVRDGATAEQARQRLLEG